MNPKDRVIVIASGKGGVGKTSIAVNLAAEFANAGQRVLVADFDPQGTAALLFQVAEQPGVSNVLMNGGAVEAQLIEIARERWATKPQAGALWLLPGNNETAAAAISLYLEGRSLDVVAELLWPLVGDLFDFIILDTPPSVHPLAPYVYRAAGFAVVPTDCGIEGVSGFFQTQTNISNAPGAGTQIIAVVPDRIPHSTLLHDQMISRLYQEFEDLVCPPLYQYDAWAKAAFTGQTMAVCAPRTRAYSEFRFVYRNIVRALRQHGVDFEAVRRDE